MGNEKGQVTLFIIMAIVIVIIGTIFFFLYKQQLKQAEISEAELVSVKSYFKDRINYATENSLLLIGLQGGYRTYPYERLELQFNLIPFYYYSRNIKIPNKEQINHDLSEEIRGRLNDVQFNLTNLEIIKEQPQVLINLTDKTEIKIDYPLTIKKGKETITLLNSYEYQYNLNFEKFINISQIIVKDISNNSIDINLELLLELQNKSQLIISPILYEEKTIIYRIYDNQTRINENPFEFDFAIKNE